MDDAWEYQAQLDRYEAISTCGTAPCLSRHLEGPGVAPTYLYVPKGHYTVRGQTVRQSPEMRPSLLASDEYRIVHETAGVMLVRVVEDPESAAQTRS